MKLMRGYYRLNATSLVSFTNGSLTGVSTCRGQQSQLSFSGLQHFSLEPGCVLNVAGVTFVAAFNPGVSVQQVVSFFPANFSLFDNDSALLSDISRALSSSEKIDLSTLVRGGGGEELRSLPWDPTSSHVGMFWAVSGSVMLVLFILLVSVWVLRRRIFRYIVRELGETDRFHISPSPVEWPSPGPDPGLSYRMNELVHRLARLRDTEGAREEGEREEEVLEGPSGDSEETGNSCPSTA